MNTIKKIFLIFLTIILTTSIGYSAGSSGGSSGGNSGGENDSRNNLEYQKNLEYKKAVRLIKKAKKLEKKKKLDKLDAIYTKAREHLTNSFKINPDDPNILNYLGFTTRKLGDFKNAETYYLMGLKIDPNHNGINEYLGELYVQTNRLEKAKERLSVLKNCNCEEYSELKEIIEGTKTSKY